MKKILVLSALLLNSQNTLSVVHEYAEDSYFAPADQTIVDKVDRIAQLNSFTIPYEILIPKKPALQMNVWHRAIALSQGVNKITGNPFIIINPSWVNTLNDDEQTALMSTYFQQFKDSSYPYFVKYYLPYIKVAITFILFIIFIITLSRISYFRLKPRYYSIIAAIIISNVLEIAVMDRLLRKFNICVEYNLYATPFIQRALDVTHNKQAMISVYEKLLAFVEQSMKDGEKNLEATRNSYIKIIDWLKTQS